MMDEHKAIVSLTEDELNALQDKWEADGFEFAGNGFLDRDDPPSCPACGETGYFYALWKHPTRKTEETLDDGSVLSLSAIKVMNRCYECGHDWSESE